MREQDRKGIETRKLLGPRLPKSPPIRDRVVGELPYLRSSGARRAPRLPRDSG